MQAREAAFPASSPGAYAEGEERALARLISALEDGEPGRDKLSESCDPIGCARPFM